MAWIEALKQTELGREFLTFLISMVPVLELRGAIPMGVAMGLDPWKAMIVADLGNMVPVPFIIIFIRNIFDWMQSKSKRLSAWVEKTEAKAATKWEQVHKYELLGLALLVAIPLPGTGAWTGALVAALMDIRLKHAFPTIFLGVIAAGFIVLVLTQGFTTAFAG
ncbi:MAG: COG2426 family protein [Oscillospiraceae bacterium]